MAALNFIKKVSSPVNTMVNVEENLHHYPVRERIGVMYGSGVNL